MLRPDEMARHVAIERSPASGPAARWVENHWSLAWDLPAGRRFASQVLPHPTCALTSEVADHPRPEVGAAHAVVVTGVVTRRFDVDARGRGRVAGTRFRPGGLAALTGRPARAWTDRTLPAADVLPAAACAALAGPGLAEHPREWADRVERALGALGDVADPRYDELLAVVADMLADHTLVTVADVCARHGVTPRTLQRTFTHYVGVGPKWVLARYRMHDVVTALDAGHGGTLTDLAAAFGWYDQAHFTRDFTALVGVPPSRYRQEAAARAGAPVTACG